MNNAAMTYKEECEALRAEVERLKADKATAVEKMHESANQFVEFMHGPHSQVATERDELRQQLAISQLEAKRLWEALTVMVAYAREDGCGLKIADEAISSPTSTEALNAYVAEKVKDATIGHVEDLRFKNKEIEELRRIKMARFNNEDCWIYQGDGEDHFESLSCPVVVYPSVLIELTRQRDLAVSAIENLVKQKGRHNTEIAYKKLVEALAAIKESGATK